MGYMHLIIGVTKDRLELLSTYPPVGISKYVPPFVLLLLVLAHDCILAAQLWQHTEGPVNFAVWCLRMYDIVHTALLGLKTLIRDSECSPASSSCLFWLLVCMPLCEGLKLCWF